MASRYSHGLRSYGMPVLPGISDGGYPTTGDVWWVHSGTGSDSNNGKSPDTPFATLDEAFATNHVTANNGDIVYVMEGHNEALTAATSCVIDKAGTRIVGLGVGRTRPIFDYDNTAGTIEMDAANCTLENVILRTSVSACAVGINVDAADCKIINCEFTYESTGDDFLRAIDAAAVNRCQVINCFFQAENAKNGCKSAVVFRDSDDSVAYGNRFSGNFATACIHVLGTVSNNVLLSNNYGRNDDATAGRGIYVAVDSSGLIEFNRFTTAYTGPLDNTFDYGAMGCIENYVGAESAGAPGQDVGGARVPFSGGASDWQVCYCDATAFAGGTTNKRGDDGGTGDPYALFRVTGAVECQVFGLCGTSLAGAGGEFSVGVTGATGLFVAYGSAVSVDVGQLVHGAFTQTGLNATAPLKVVRDCSIMEWIGNANVTGGYLDYVCRWRPLKDGSHVDAVG